MALSPRRSSVTDRMREMVMNGRFQPGDHLQEIPLGEMLGVSRTPVREALVALHQEGLLTYRNHRGYLVRSFTLEEILDAYEVRGVLEGLGCRMVAERGLDPEDRRELRDLLTQGDAILSTGELHEDQVGPWRDMNDRFHAILVRGSGNPCLQDVTARTLAMPLVSTRVVHWYDFHWVRRSHQDHHIVFDAICRGHGARAENVMREHIALAIDIIRDNFRHVDELNAAAMREEG
jgi:GntR family transcriptional regulator of vanillate catabolism